MLIISFLSSIYIKSQKSWWLILRILKHYKIDESLSLRFQRSFVSMSLDYFGIREDNCPMQNCFKIDIRTFSFYSKTKKKLLVKTVTNLLHIMAWKYYRNVWCRVVLLCWYHALLTEFSYITKPSFLMLLSVNIKVTATNVIFIFFTDKK